MNFLLYRFKQDPDQYVVTDESHEKALSTFPALHGNALERVGEFPEVGADRAIFDEASAKQGIASQGFYQFKAHGLTHASERASE